MNTSNKEIDIFELYQRTTNFMKRRWLLIVILSLVGAGLGFVKNNCGQSEYQGNIVISSDIIVKNDLYEKIIPLEVQGQRPSSQRFSSLLDVKPIMFKELTAFKIDTVSLKNAIVLEFQHKDSLMVIEIANAFSNFYQSQSDFVTRFNYEEEINRKYLNYIDDEINDLNNYQEKVLQGTGSNELVMMNLTGSSEEIISLYERQVNYQKKLENKNVVSVSYDSAYVVPKTSLINSMLLWGFIFAFLALFVALILELDREVKKRIQ
ncbi:MAG: hypothetical protein PF448_00020 [Bacteroidales bacterium]|jgi:hypothetical protein|nr:hypothetical protein [Bacteroidales bacterium]